MGVMFAPRRTRIDSRFALCVVAVFLLHGTLLAFSSPSTRRHSSAAPVMVRSLEAPSPLLSESLLAPSGMLATLPKMTLQPHPRRVIDLPVTTLESRADAAAPELQYPDAGLPGGKARAQVALSVGYDGYVEGIAIEQGALPEAFENAIQRAFAGRLLSLEPRGGQSKAVLLCIEVHFREGEAPSWQRIAPTGICAS